MEKEENRREIGENFEFKRWENGKLERIEIFGKCYQDNKIRFLTVKYLFQEMFDKVHVQPSFNPTQKPGTPSTTPSKSHIMNWLKTMFPDLPSIPKIQDLGNGTLYCRIINHYHPGTIPLTKIHQNPKNQYQILHNLKQAQQGLVQSSIKINFDANKLSKRKFLQNWTLINAMYRHFTSEETTEEPVYSSITRPVGKRTYDMAFPDHQFESGAKENQYNQNMNYVVPVWERSALNLCFNNPMNPIKANPFSKDSFGTCSPVKGKWSVNSHTFENSSNAVLDRIKSIIMKCTDDQEKVKQMKILLNLPQEQENIKLEEDFKHYNPNYKGLRRIIEDAREDRDEDLEKREKDKYQSETHPQKKVINSMKLKKPFKV